MAFRATILVLALAAAVFAAPAEDKNDDERILNGRQAPANAYPSVCSMQTAKFMDTRMLTAKFCGGVLLDQHWVLSAAHCFQRPESTPDLHILCGTTNAVGYFEPTAQHIRVEKVYNHENYENATFKDDIALLRLAEPARFNQAVQPIALPPRNYVANGEGTIVGWGAVDVDEKVSAHNLMVARIRVSDIDDCRRKGLPMYGHQICLGAFDSTNACAGDSGGPFIQNINNRPAVVGVTSFGAEGCHEEKPIVYTSISAYLDWIARIKANHK